jgi:hypothetical protein
MDQIDRFFEQDDEEPPETFREDFMQKPNSYIDNTFEDGKNAEHGVASFHETDHTTNASYVVSDRDLSIEELLNNDNNNKFSSRQNSFHHNENYVGENGQFIDHSPMHPGHEDDHSVNVKRKISLDDFELPSEIKLNKKIKSSENAMTSNAFYGRNALVDNDKISQLNSSYQWAQMSGQFIRPDIGLLEMQKIPSLQISTEVMQPQNCMDYCDQDDLFAEGQHIHKCKKSIIQNYIAATSNGFAKMLSVYGTNKCSEFYAAIVASVQTLLLERREFQNTQISPFVDLILKYTKENIEGKMLKQTHKGKSWSQYKVSNKEEIHQIFHDQLNEDPTNRGIKRVLRELIVYFFHSKYYFEWVAEHYRTKKQENKKFFYDKENIEEMVRVYLNPHKCRSHFM